MNCLFLGPSSNSDLSPFSFSKQNQSGNEINQSQETNKEKAVGEGGGSRPVDDLITQLQQQLMLQQQQIVMQQKMIEAQQQKLAEQQSKIERYRRKKEKWALEQRNLEAITLLDGLKRLLGKGRKDQAGSSGRRSASRKAKEETQGKLHGDESPGA